MKIKATSLKTIITLSSVIGILMGAILSYFLFPRVITERENIVSERRVTDTVFVEKLVYRTKTKVVKECDSSVKQASDSIMLLDSNINQDVLTDDNLKFDGDTSLVEIDAVENGHDSISGSEKEYLVSSGSKIRVAQNELVYSVRIRPEGDPSNFYCRKNNELDSLLVDNYVPEASEESVSVEFWASPIHSVGYRLSKSRLILFGFYEYKNVKLKYLEDGGIQMKYFENVYVLKCGDEFNALNIKKR